MTWPELPRLDGQRVWLDQLGPDVFDAYWELLADEEGRRLTGTTEYFDEPQIRQWLSTRAGTPARYDWAIYERATGEVAGEVVLNEHDPERGSMNLRIALRGPAWFGRGLGSDAIRVVVGFARESLPLVGLTLSVLTDNVRAIRSYEHSGFVRVGGEFEEAGLRYQEMSVSW